MERKRERAGRTVESIVGEFDVEDGGGGELQVDEGFALVLGVAFYVFLAWWGLVCVDQTQVSSTKGSPKLERCANVQRTKGLDWCSGARASLTNS
jgi:hypothetical protein